VKACQKLHERAAAVTRESIWTKLYCRGFDPVEAAELAARECHAPARLGEAAAVIPPTGAFYPVFP
jgi:hypothetical protein